MEKALNFEKLGVTLAVCSALFACAALLVMLVFIRLGGYMLCASCFGLLASLACMVLDDAHRDRIRREQRRHA